jgi:hypothetical protein
MLYLCSMSEKDFKKLIRRWAYGSSTLKMRGGKEGEVRLCGEKFITDVDGPSVFIYFVLTKEAMSEVTHAVREGNFQGVEIMMEGDWCRFVFSERREIGKIDMSRQTSFIFSRERG